MLEIGYLPLRFSALYYISNILRKIQLKEF